MNRPQKRQDYGKGTRLRPGDLITADLVNQILTLVFGLSSASDRLSVDYTGSGVVLDLDLEHLLLLDPNDYSLQTRLKVTTDTPPNAILQAKKVKLAFAAKDTPESGKLQIANTTATDDSAWVDLVTFSGVAIAPVFRVFDASGTKKLQMKKIAFKLPAATSTGPETIGLETVPGTADTDWVNVIQLAECDTPE